MKTRRLTARQETDAKWEAWSNAALARDAARAVREDERPTLAIDASDDYYSPLGPMRLATAREHFAMAYSERRSWRRSQLDVPPGVGLSRAERCERD